MILVFCGDGSVAGSIVTSGTAGNFATVYFGFGFGLMLGLYVAIGVAGFLNPAITLCMAVFKKVPWIDAAAMIAAEFLGAFVGAALVFAVYIGKIDAFDGGTRQIQGPTGTGLVFFSGPFDDSSNLECAVSQIIGSALMGIASCAIRDDRSRAVLPFYLRPLISGLCLFLLGCVLGANTGFAFNPARDFGSRMFAYAAGWGTAVFTNHDYYFWIPLIFPFVGVIVGYVLYEGFIVYEEERDLEAPSSLIVE